MFSKEKLLSFCFLSVLGLVFQNCFAANEVLTTYHPAPAEVLAKGHSQALQGKHSQQLMLAALHSDTVSVTGNANGTYAITANIQPNAEVALYSGNGSVNGKRNGITINTLAMANANAFFDAWEKVAPGTAVKDNVDQETNPNAVFVRRASENNKLQNLLADVQLKSYDRNTGAATFAVANISANSNFALPKVGETANYSGVTMITSGCCAVSDQAFANLMKNGVKLAALGL